MGEEWSCKHGIVYGCSDCNGKQELKKEIASLTAQLTEKDKRIVELEEGFNKATWRASEYQKLSEKEFKEKAIVKDRLSTAEGKNQKYREALDSPELLEKLADIEHQRWSRWYLYMEVSRTQDNMARWEILAHTHYSTLSEKSKESDRKEVREYLEAIRQALNLESK